MNTKSLPQKTRELRNLFEGGLVFAEAIEMVGRPSRDAAGDYEFRKLESAWRGWEGA